MIVDTAMQMKAQEFAVQYSTGVMKAVMDFTEDVSALLTQQMSQLDVGPAEMHMVDVLA